MSDGDTLFAFRELAEEHFARSKEHQIRVLKEIQPTLLTMHQREQECKAFAARVKAMRPDLSDIIDNWLACYDAILSWPLLPFDDDTMNVEMAEPVPSTRRRWP